MHDRREFQRLRLSKPILATIGSANALMLDVGVAGAYLEHYGVFKAGERFRLKFRWQGNDIEFLCEVTRSDVVRVLGGDGESTVSHSGVRFVEAAGESAERLQDMIATSIGKLLAAQRSNASGTRDESGAAILADIGGARRLRARGYVAYRLHRNRWTRTPTQSPEQPADGFTVAAYEDHEEIETLCRTYESADDEGRRLIRMVAELSVISAPK